MATENGSILAHDILQKTHEKGYRYPENFAGYQATFVYIEDEKIASGTVEIQSPKKIVLTTPADEEVKTWIQRELASISGHRWFAPYSEGDGRYTLELGAETNHPLGRLLTFADDPFNSYYRVREDQISQVNRKMGKMRFSINIQDKLVTSDGRTLTTYFTVLFWDEEQKRLNRTDIYSDSYVVVEGIYLPEVRQIITATDTGIVTRCLKLKEHSLLLSPVEASQATITN